MLLYLNMTRKYLTVREFADIYRISARTVLRMIQRGETKAIKKARKWLIPADENNIDEQI